MINCCNLACSVSISLNLMILCRSLSSSACLVLKASSAISCNGSITPATAEYSGAAPRDSRTSCTDGGDGDIDSLDNPRVGDSGTGSGGGVARSAFAGLEGDMSSESMSRKIGVSINSGVEGTLTSVVLGGASALSSKSPSSPEQMGCLLDR